MSLTSILVRLGLAVSLIVSAASHAYLYVHGYRHIPTIGTAFMVQASLSFAIALLILDRRSRLAALGRLPPWRLVRWSHSFCRAPSACPASSNGVGSRRRTPPSA